MNLKSFLAESAAAPEFDKYLKKAERNVRSEMGAHFKLKPSPKLEVKVESPYKARITIDFQRVMDPKSIIAADEDFEFALSTADVNGHIHKLEVGNSNGPEFVEAFLSGLRPGMKLNAEAFFPTLEYVVTFKQVISRK
jgi:hypothetical protein